MRVRVDDGDSKGKGNDCRRSNTAEASSSASLSDEASSSRRDVPALNFRSDFTSSSTFADHYVSLSSDRSSAVYDSLPHETARISRYSRSSVEDEPYNSEDEHEAVRPRAPLSEWDFAEIMRKQGLVIVPVKPDGNCLFRALAIHVYNSEDTHSYVREEVLDFIESEREWFSGFLAEDFERYISRKRRNGCHGNHLELQAGAELYESPIHVYAYRAEPVNVIDCVSRQGSFPQISDARFGRHSEALQNRSPIRLSFHRGSHYNCVLTVDQYSRFQQATYEGSPPRPRRSSRSRLAQSRTRHGFTGTGGFHDAASNLGGEMHDSSQRNVGLSAVTETNSSTELQRQFGSFENDEDVNRLADAIATEEEMERAAMALSLAEARQSAIGGGTSASASSSSCTGMYDGSLIGVQALVDMGFSMDIALEAYQNTDQGSPQEMIHYINRQISEAKRARATKAIHSVSSATSSPHSFRSHVSHRHHLRNSDSVGQDLVSLSPPGTSINDQRCHVNVSHDQTTSQTDISRDFNSDGSGRSESHSNDDQFFVEKYGTELPASPPREDISER